MFGSVRGLEVWNEELRGRRLSGPRELVSSCTTQGVFLSGILTDASAQVGWTKLMSGVRQVQIQEPPLAATQTCPQLALPAYIILTRPVSLLYVYLCIMLNCMQHWLFSCDLAEDYIRHWNPSRRSWSRVKVSRDMSCVYT